MQPRNRLALGSILLSALVFWVPPWLSLAVLPQANLQSEVQKLVKQLGDPDAAKQAAAETALLKLGPDILPLLPPAAGNKRLQAIRRILRDAQARKDLAPRLFSLRKTLPLSQALKQLASQTGIQVDDHRPSKDENPKVKLDLQKVTFWQALDAIAREADLRVDLYQRDRQIALVEGPHRELPTSYSGLFRIVLKRVETVRDFETDAHLCRARLEIAWEPRFQALYVQTRPEAIEVKDDKGNSLKTGGATGRAAVGRGLAVDLPVLSEAPRRTAKKLDLLKGSLAIVGPSKILSFTFDDLAKAKDKPPRAQTKEGVTVTLREFTINASGDQWTVGFQLQYPAEGPEFESFESWLVTSQIYLVKKDDPKKRFTTRDYDIDTQRGNRATISYTFVDGNGLVLGKPGDWKLVFEPPGRMVSVPLQFDFKDVPLP